MNTSCVAVNVVASVWLLVKCYKVKGETDKLKKAMETVLKCKNYSST